MENKKINWRTLLVRHRIFLIAVVTLLGVVAVGYGCSSCVKQPVSSQLSATQLQKQNQAAQLHSSQKAADKKGEKITAEAKKTWHYIAKKRHLKYANSLKKFQRYYGQSPAAYLATYLGYSVNYSLRVVPPSMQTSGEQQQAAQLAKNNTLQ